MGRAEAHTGASSGRRLELAAMKPQAQDNLTFRAGPDRPVLRAIPFPEVTELFCRLPLSTFFYRPEAANLGDLMRLWVRPGV